MASPKLKHLRNNESPKPPPVKALFQQTPKISSHHAITTPGNTGKTKGARTPQTRTRVIEALTWVTATAQSGTSNQQGNNYNSSSDNQEGRTAKELQDGQDPPQQAPWATPGADSRTQSDPNKVATPDEVSPPPEQPIPAKAQNMMTTLSEPRQEMITTLQNTTHPVRTMAKALQEPATVIKEMTMQEGNQEETTTLIHSPMVALTSIASPASVFPSVAWLGSACTFWSLPTASPELSCASVDWSVSSC